MQMQAPRETGGIADRFWSFSVDVYGRPDVAPACLALQDGLGLDVNLLLFCCFAAAEGAPPLGRDALRAADAAAAPWRTGVIEPLRAVRRTMKADFAGVDPAWRESVRKDIQAAELECERIVQALIGASMPPGAAQGGDSVPAAATNLTDYLSVRGVRAEDEVRRYLVLLIAQAVAGGNVARAEAALEQAS